MVSRRTSHRAAALVQALWVCASGSAQTLLHTTLDDAASVLSPQAGTGVLAAAVTSPVNDFVPAEIGNGVRIDESGEYVRFLQRFGITRNIELDEGAIEFWYQPSYDHTDDVDHWLFSSGPRGIGSGSLHVRKAGGANGNAFQVTVFDTGTQFQELSIPSSNYGWLAGQRFEVRVTWDFTVLFTHRNMHVFFNDVEAVPQLETTGPLVMPSESDSKFLYIGAEETFGLGHATGIIDDFRISGPPATDDPIFFDGFELGDTSAWSDQVP